MEEEYVAKGGKDCPLGVGAEVDDDHADGGIREKMGAACETESDAAVDGDETGVATTAADSGATENDGSAKEADGIGIDGDAKNVGGAEVNDSDASETGDDGADKCVLQMKRKRAAPMTAATAAPTRAATAALRMALPTLK